MTTQKSNLMARTLDLLREDERSTHTIAAEAKVPFYWLRKFRSGAMQNPSVNRVQALYEHLTGKKLLHA